MNCVLCYFPCKSSVFDRIQLPCGAVAHFECHKRIDLLNACPGTCCRPKGTLEGFLHGILGDALRPKCLEIAHSGQPLVADDIADLIELNHFDTLSRIYQHGIGVPRNVLLADKYRATAVEQDDPSALFDTGMRTNTLKLVERAAVLGHMRANSVMMQLYSGANVCGIFRPKNPKFADTYAKRAALKGDALARIQIALCDVDETSLDAEKKLLDARDYNFVTEPIYQSLTERVLNMRVRRGSYADALQLPCRRKTPNSRVDCAVALHALGRYAEAAVELEIAQSPDADICLAKMVESGTYVGDADELYARAAKAGHPEAGFHFLCMYIDESEKKARPYFKMLLNAKDSDMLLRWAAHFDDMGKCAIANAIALRASVVMSKQ